LDKYGFQLEQYIATKTPLFVHLLSHAPLCPLEVYSLAASLALEELAKSASAHLISFPLYGISDETASEMGPIYLKRLFLLHWNRTNELKRLLLIPPRPHPVTKACDFTAQKTLVRTWASVIAPMAWDIRPDATTAVVESALRQVQDDLKCELCLEVLSNRLKDLVKDWVMVQGTI
jgi:hypothetical protein